MKTLVLGGARSGKSAHAEGLVPGDAPVRYVATARRDPDDQEWAARIDEHVRRRPAIWSTVEAPDTTTLLAVLGAAQDGVPILVDDLATWLTGVLDDTGGWEGSLAGARTAREQLCDAIDTCPNPLVMVSAEVGLGVVPATRSGRLFRDELGALNAEVARRCTEVTLLVAGIALRLR